MGNNDNECNHKWKFTNDQEYNQNYKNEQNYNHLSKNLLNYESGYDCKHEHKYQNIDTSSHKKKNKKKPLA